MTTVARAFAGVGLFLLCAMVLVAFILSIINFVEDTTTTAATARYAIAAQTITGLGIVNVLFDSEARPANNIVYDPAGIFQVQKTGTYLITANFSVDVSGSGGGGATPGPVTTWVEAAGQTTLLRGLTISQPLSTTAGSTNRQAVTVCAQMRLLNGDKFAIKCTAPTMQLLAGANRMMNATLVSTA